MGTSPDGIAAEIAETRAELAADVDRLADHARPGNMARRRMNRMRSAVNGLRDQVMGSAVQSTQATRDTVMGTAGQTVETTRQAAGQAAEAVKSAPDQVIRQAQGNPFAAGLIVFGAGLLAASLVPGSQAERRAGAQLREQGAGLVEPVKQAVTESGQQLTDDLGTQAKQAASEVKKVAGQAAQETGQQARDQARQVAGQARESGQRVAGSTESL
jgi:hypothetical protein